MRKYILVAVLMSGVAFAQPTPAPAPTVQPNQPAEYVLKLAPLDVELIGKALGGLPFNEAAPIIQKLRQQIVDQQQPLKSVPTVVPKK